MENNNQKQVTFEDIENNEEINEYITKGNEYLGVMNYTEHGFAHLKRSAVYARRILEDLGYDERTCELAAIDVYKRQLFSTVHSACKINYFTHFVIILIKNFPYRKQPSE